jgi:hypothetical protein
MGERKRQTPVSEKVGLTGIDAAGEAVSRERHRTALQHIRPSAA